MKLAVIKLGARISYSENNTSGGTGEALSIIKMLTEGGAEVHAYTKVLKKDPEPPKGVQLHNIETELLGASSSYDALVVINGTVNFFGGQEDRSQILNYQFINTFVGPVFYIYCDPNLPLKQIWPAVANKPWAGYWRQDEIEITRTDIRVISQSYGLPTVKELFNKTGIKFKSFDQYPFEKFPMLLDPIENNPEVDISYGGTFRSGRRENKLVEFYFGYPEDISVEVFGKIKLEDFDPKKIENLRPPVFTGPVNYNDMLPKMSKALSHIVIGDNHYPKIGMISQRTYEAVQSGCITFLDDEFDRSRRVFGVDKELTKYLYVKSVQEVTSRILDAKSTNSAKEIVLAQRKAIGFNSKEYCEGLINLIKEYV